MWAKAIRLRGPVSIAILITVSLALAWEGKLGFFIHPRYNFFTVSMGVVGLGLVLIATIKRNPPHDHDRVAAGMGLPKRTRRLSIWEGLSGAVVAVIVLLAVVLPPAALTSATAENRSATVPAPPESEDSIGDISVAFESLTVRDWARLLVATQDPSFYRGKTFNAEGSIIKSTDPDVFLLTRFVVTCCAVDAAPVSVPVFLPGWQNDPLLEGWIRVSGEFHTAEQPGDWGALVLVPREIRQEEAPDAPYLF